MIGHRSKSRVQRLLFESDSRPRFGRAETVVMLLYIALVSTVVLHHEPWHDEAQGWLIAKYSSFGQLFGRVLHYEGAPGLWSALLFAAAHLGLPFQAMNWLAAALGMCATYLLLRYSTFPPLLRRLLPFTFFLQYQYAVVARPYPLFPPLVFLLCILFTLPRPRPLLFALAAGVAANINLHCTAYVCALGAVYLYSLCMRRGTPQRVTLARSAGAVAIFCGLVTLALVTALPAPDQSKAPQTGLSHTIAKMWIAPEVTPAGYVPDPIVAPLPDKTPPKDHFFYRGKAGAWVRATVLQFRPAVDTVIRGLEGMDLSISNSNLLALAFVASFVAWLWSRHALFQLLPPAVLVLCFAVVWLFDHHSGLFFVAVIAASWMVWGTTAQVRGAAWVQPVFCTLFLVVALLQVGWSAAADADDVRGLYDASGYTQKFLAEHYAGKRIAGFTVQAVPLQLYFAQNPFFNWDRRYWMWADVDTPDTYRLMTLAQHPDVIVTGYMVSGDHAVWNAVHETQRPDAPLGGNPAEFFEARGWQTTHVFCGSHFGHGSTMVNSCLEVLEPRK